MNYAIIQFVFFCHYIFCLPTPLDLLWLHILHAAKLIISKLSTHFFLNGKSLFVNSVDAAARYIGSQKSLIQSGLVVTKHLKTGKKTNRYSGQYAPPLIHFVRKHTV